ncbi:MAG: PaaI family thioesterase [Thermoleophilia bacterium]|nr:PaaI family thioesterase [Thermoleophilia bacterium]
MTAGRASFTELEALGRDGLVGLLGIEFPDLAADPLVGTMRAEPRVMAPNGFLHGGAVVAFADTVCGYACWRGLPDDATGFATVDLSASFVGTARDGGLSCTATRLHAGRSTEVWDARVDDEAGRAIAHFRCTQMILRAPAR